MGGVTFTTPGPDGPALQVPRLSLEQYVKMRKYYIEALKPYFPKVLAMPEVPGKADYGDIDLIVVQNDRNNASTKELGDAIGARRSALFGPTTSYAVPLDPKQDTYVQLDVHRCPEEFFEWECFMKSYGDMWQIIGLLQRNIGLTATDKGLHVRVLEWEGANREKSKLYLTHDVSAIMKFLGLDEEAYARGFDSVEEIFQWICAGRFFTRELLDQRRENSNDRARHRKRPMFRRFLEEWVPANPDAGLNKPVWTREQVMEEALKTFGKREEYRAMVEEKIAKDKEDALWAKIKALLPLENEQLGEAMRGLRRFLRVEDGQPVVCTSWDNEIADRQPLLPGLNEESEKRLLEWIRGHWEELKKMERERAKARKAGYTPT